MSAFAEILPHVLQAEGIYSFDPDDAGGETYRGISRRYHPSWPGWVEIDRLKKSGGVAAIRKAWDENALLRALVADFYREQFWERFQGDRLPHDVAAEVFDTAVNTGVHRAVIWLQRAWNLLNRNGADYRDIVEDGQMGPGTLAALNAYLKKDNTAPLLKVMNILQGAHYLEYMKKSPAQEKYARGWLNRVAVPPAQQGA